MGKAEQKGSISMDEVMTNPTIDEVKAEENKKAGKKRGRKSKSATPPTPTPTLSERLAALQPEGRTGNAALVESHYGEIRAALERKVSWKAIAQAFKDDGHEIDHKALGAIFSKICKEKGDPPIRERKPKAENAETI